MLGRIKVSAGWMVIVMPRGDEAAIFVEFHIVVEERVEDTWHVENECFFAFSVGFLFVLLGYVSGSILKVMVSNSNSFVHGGEMWP